MAWTVLIALFFGGLLAGGELVVRFGVRGPLARLDPHSHIEMRQGLIRTLRVLVPTLFALAFLSNVAAAIAATTPLRIGVVVLLLGFISVTLAGTVPINPQSAVGTLPPLHQDGKTRSVDGNGSTIGGPY